MFYFPRIIASTSPTHKANQTAKIYTLYKIIVIIVKVQLYIFKSFNEYSTTQHTSI